MQRLPLLATLALASFPFSAHAAQAWAPGVSESGGYFDWNKTCQDSNNYMADMGMCWAACASNLISWWQTQNADKLADSVPTNTWDVFRTVYKDVGGQPYTALDWWVNGMSKSNGDVNYPDTMDTDLRANPPQGYWSGMWDGGFLKNVYDTGAYPILVANAGNESDMYAFTAKIVNALNSGYALSISFYNSNLAHGYTLWGVEYTETDAGLEITKAWLTDSDDTGSTAGIATLFSKDVKCETSAKGDWSVHFDENMGGSWQYISGLRTAPIPESSAFSLLAGLAAVALVASRRRR